MIPWTSLLQGFGLTLSCTALSLILGLGLGGLFFFLLRFSPAYAQKGFQALITLIRALPEILIVFACYFGLSELFNCPPLLTGVCALGVIFAAFASQVFAMADRSVMPGSRQASMALGLSNWHYLRYIYGPQLLKAALPGLANLLQTLIKDTALLSLIGLPDLLSQAQVLASSLHQPFQLYLIISVMYCGLGYLAERLCAYVGRRAI